MKAATAFSVLATAAAAGGAVFLAFVPVYHGVRCGGAPSRQTCEELPSRTLIEENGAWVLLLLAVPLALTFAGLASVRWRLPRALTWATAVALLAACSIAIFSIGAFFLPAALLLLAAAVARAWEQAAER